MLGTNFNKLGENFYNELTHARICCKRAEHGVLFLV